MSDIQIYSPLTNIEKLNLRKDKDKPHSRTSEFRTEALHFQEFGKYTNLQPSTSAYKTYWKEQTRRCLEGYNAGFDYITGYHYWYLNFSPILKVIYDENSNFQEDKQIQGQRVEGFPNFWDSDYKYFWYLEEAEMIGKHAVVVKTRGRGYSFKGGSMMCRNYFLIPNSRSYAFAAESEFLVKDGLLTKAWANMAFIDDNTPWAKRRQGKNTDMHKRASYLESDNGVMKEKGFMSEIIGVSLKDKPNKGRGKRSKLILFEEGGNFPELIKTWQVSEPSVETGKVTFGLRIAFGTGGSEEADYSGLEELYYNPTGYKIHTVKDIWEDGREDEDVGFFVSEIDNMEGFMDKDGNSDREGALKQVLKERDIVRTKTKDPNALAMLMAEKPLNAAEAFLRVSTNNFPVHEIMQWEAKLTTDKKLDIATHGFMSVNTEGKAEFVVDWEAKPITDFPLKKDKGQDKSGCVSIYWSPYKVQGVVPENIYFVCADPYGLNTSGGESLGAAYVLCNPNKFTQPDDCIVASYIGRPSSQNEWNRQLFLLAEMYNAKITFENDRGNIIEYAQNNRLLNQLQEEFTIYDTDGNPTNKLGRHYGISMNNRNRKLQAAQYLKDWLLQPRGRDTAGNIKLNLHFIYDVALLKELRKWDLKGNFDRTSSLLVGMLYQPQFLNEAISYQKSSVSEDFRKINFWS